jgi:hypothetical protein
MPFGTSSNTDGGSDTAVLMERFWYGEGADGAGLKRRF